MGYRVSGGEITERDCMYVVGSSGQGWQRTCT